MRNAFMLAAVCAVALSFTACCGDNALFGAGASPETGCGSLIYKAPHCPPKLELPGLPYPGSPVCQTPPPAAAADPCPQGVAAPAPAEPQCGPLPTNAKVGEVWCCEFVQPPAAAPVDVEVAPARTEWQRVTCENGSNDCWALVTVPAQIEHRVSAPPPGYYEWRRNGQCEASRAK